MRYFAFICLSLSISAFFPSAIRATQGAGALTGRVIDRTTDHPVADVTLRLESVATALRTDADGRFSFSQVPPGIYTLSAHRLGYRAVTICSLNVAASSRTDIVLRLEPTPVQLPPVWVTADRTMADLEDHYEGVRLIIDPVHQGTVPGTLGDPLRGLRNLPAFGMANDCNGLLYARGGSPDQNLVLLDHTSIPYPYRLRLLMGGGISAFPPEIISYFEAMPGGFPARYGDRTSAVIHLHTREASRERRSLACHLDVLAASAVLEQPLFRGGGSVLVAGRRSVLDLIGSALSEGPYAFPRFEDLFVKVSLTPLAGNKVNLTLAEGKEGTTLTPVESEKMALSQRSHSRTLMVNWASTVSKRLLIGASLSRATDANQLLFVDQAHATYRAHLEYRTAEWGARAWLYLRVNSNLALEAGASLLKSHSVLGWESRWRSPLEFPLIVQCQYEPTIVGGYLENHLQITPCLEAALGLRADYASLSGEQVVSPRLNLVFRCAPKTKVFAAWGDFYQFPSLLSTISRNEPLIIADVTRSLKAEKATHYIVGGERQLAKVLQGKITGYFKSYARLLLPLDHMLYRACNSGEGYASGVELSVDTLPGLSSRLSYHVHYAATRSRYRRVGRSGWIPVAWERPHTFGARVEARVVGDLAGGLGWNYASGRPRLKGVASDKESRFAPYSRLDMRVSYSIRLPIRKEVTLYVEVINVTNERNVYDTTWDFHSPERSASRPSTIYMMPRMLSLGCGTRM